MIPDYSALIEVVKREADELIMDAIVDVFEDAPCVRYFEALLEYSATSASGIKFANALGIHDNTLRDRMTRFGLPSPKVYISYMRLVRAAKLLEEFRDFPLVARALGYSSAVVLGQRVRSLLDLTLTEFHGKYDGKGMLRQMMFDLVLPHRHVLTTYNPLPR